MLVSITGEGLIAAHELTELREYVATAVTRLRSDLLFWNQFQIHWLHALHYEKLGPDLGGEALEGYPPCTIDQATANLIHYSEYQFKRVNPRVRRGFTLTEGLIRFFGGDPLDLLPERQPGLWVDKKFHDFYALSSLYALTPEETYRHFTGVIEGN